MSYEIPHPAEAPGVKPPHSLDAEREVLAAVLVDARTVDTLTEALRADDFYFERHQILFRVFVGLHEHETAIDAVTVMQALRDRGQYEKVGGMRVLGELLDRMGTVSNLRHYIAIVRDKASQRQVLAAAQAVEVAIHAGYDGALEGALVRLDEAKAARAELLRPEASWLAATEINAASVDADAPELPVVDTGIPALNEYLPGGGYEGGNLIIAIAAPKTGKTTYALGNVARTACEKGGRVLYCALSDAGLVRLNRKLMCGVSGVPDRAVKRRDLTVAQHEAWAKAADKIASWKLHIERIKNPKAIVARARALQREGDLVLVVVDYLQKTDSGMRELWQNVAEATTVLQDGAVDLGVPFLVLSQPTTTARREGKRIKASDAKGGGTPEEDGDIVMLLTKGTRDPKAAGLEILAGRDVSPHVWHAEASVVDGKSVYPCGWRWDYTHMRLEAT